MANGLNAAPKPAPLNTAEIRRKAQAGIALTNPTAEAMKIYSQYKPSTPAVTSGAASPTAPKPATAPIANSAEIIRKAQAGIPLTNPTPQSVALYNQNKTTNAATTPATTKPPAQTGAAAAPVTPTTAPANLNTAEIIRKAKAGIPLTNPTKEALAIYNQYKPATAKTPANGITPAMDAEIKRKAELGIPLDNATKEKQALYDQYQRSIPMNLIDDMAKKLQEQAEGEAVSARNQADVVNMQNARALQEMMANRGLGASGENITATLQQNAQRQNALNAINNQLASNISQIGMDASNKKLSQWNTNADRALQIANLTGLYNGNKTLASQEFEYGKQQDAIRNAMEEAGLTGTYKGKSTQSKVEADRDYQLALKQLAQSAARSSGGGGGSGGSSGSGSSTMKSVASNTIIDNINSKYFTKDSSGKNTFNLNAVNGYIDSLNIPDAQKEEIMNYYYGLSQTLGGGGKSGLAGLIGTFWDAFTGKK